MSSPIRLVSCHYLDIQLSVGFVFKRQHQKKRPVLVQSTQSGQTNSPAVAQLRSFRVSNKLSVKSMLKSTFSSMAILIRCPPICENMTHATPVFQLVLIIR